MIFAAVMKKDDDIRNRLIYAPKRLEYLSALGIACVQSTGHPTHGAFPCSLGTAATTVRVCLDRLHVLVNQAYGACLLRGGGITRLRCAVSSLLGEAMHKKGHQDEVYQLQSGNEGAAAAGRCHRSGYAHPIVFVCLESCRDL
jgi:hypothetical protein